MKTIFLDAGHGGNDPGAVSNEGIEEEDINLEVVLSAGIILRDAGFSVFYTRDKDKKLSPSQRLQIIKAYNPNAFISVHCNASNSPSAHGIETIYKDEYDKPLAMSVHNSLIETTELRDRGIKQDVRNLAVLKDLETPAILIEIGFISNEEELEFIQSNIDIIAGAIAEGVIAWA